MIYRYVRTVFHGLLWATCAWLCLLGAVPRLDATCASLSSGIWHCPDTGNATTNGDDLVSFFNSKPYACGDKIILYAGVSYRGLEYFPSDPLVPLKNQTGCTGEKKTEIVSSRVHEIPAGAKKNLANYRSLMPSIEVGSNSAFRLMGSGGSNNYAFRGIRVTTTNWPHTNRRSMSNLMFGTSGIIWNASDIATIRPKNFEIDRCILEEYEDVAFGDPNTSNTNGDAFVRYVSIGISGPFENLYVHDSYIKLDGYTNSQGSAGTTDWIDITNVTATNPAVIQGTTLTTALGITYSASCTSGCDGWGDGGPCSASCKRVAIRGGTGNWTALNGIRYVRARADGDVDVINPNPKYGFYGTGSTTTFDASGLGAWTATDPDMSSVQLLTQYAFLFAGFAQNVRIIDNFMETWAIPVFMGGEDPPSIDDAVIQVGSTSTSLVLDHVRGLNIGDLVTVTVPASTSAYCYNCPKSYYVNTLRVAKVTAISGTTATVEPWGVDGLDVTPSTGGRAVWRNYAVEGVEVRGNDISRGYLHSNTDAGKGPMEIKQCNNCLIDGNVMGGYLDANNVPRGNMFGDYFVEHVNQGGWSPNTGVYNIRFANNLASGQMGDGTAGATWRQGPIGNYYHFRSHIIGKRMFWEHNVHISPVAVNYSNQSSAYIITGQDGYARHNTYAPAMAQSNAYRFVFNNDCVPSGTESFTSIWPEIGLSRNYALKDNIIGYGDSAYLGSPNAATCWPTLSDDMRNNIIIDTESVGTSTINTAFPNNYPVADYTTFWAGTCAFDSWTNCKLHASNPNKGGATDGGDPGADVEQVLDRLKRWSEQAGLIEPSQSAATMVLRSANWQLGSTKVAMTFHLSASATAACTVQIFTNANRSTAHADTSSPAACNRTGSVTSGSTVTFLAGSVAALTAATKYYYRIVDGGRVMVGSFKTQATGSGAAPKWSKGMECGSDGSSFDTSVSANTDYSIPANSVRYCRRSAGETVYILVAH